MEQEIFSQISKLTQGGLIFKNGLISIKDLDQIRSNITNLVDENILKDYEQGKSIAYSTMGVAIHSGIYPASFHSIFKVVGSSVLDQQFKVPVIDITSFSFDDLRHFFQAIKRGQANLVVFDINSENYQQRLRSQYF